MAPFLPARARLYVTGQVQVPAGADVVVPFNAVGATSGVTATTGAAALFTPAADRPGQYLVSGLLVCVASLNGQHTLDVWVGGARYARLTGTYVFGDGDLFILSFAQQVPVASGQTVQLRMTVNDATDVYGTGSQAAGNAGAFQDGESYVDISRIGPAV